MKKPNIISVLISALYLPILYIFVVHAFGYIELNQYQYEILLFGMFFITPLFIVWFAVKYNLQRYILRNTRQKIHNRKKLFSDKVSNAKRDAKLEYHKEYIDYRLNDFISIIQKPNKYILYQRGRNYLFAIIKPITERLGDDDIDYFFTLDKEQVIDYQKNGLATLDKIVIDFERDKSKYKLLNVIGEHKSPLEDIATAENINEYINRYKSNNACNHLDEYRHYPDVEFVTKGIKPLNLELVGSLYRKELGGASWISLIEKKDIKKKYLGFFPLNTAEVYKCKICDQVVFYTSGDRGIYNLADYKAEYIDSPCISHFSIPKSKINNLIDRFNFIELKQPELIDRFYYDANYEKYENFIDNYSEGYKIVNYQENEYKGISSSFEIISNPQFLSEIKKFYDSISS